MVLDVGLDFLRYSIGRSVEGECVGVRRGVVHLRDHGEGGIASDSNADDE